MGSRSPNKCNFQHATAIHTDQDFTIVKMNETLGTSISETRSDPRSYVDMLTVLLRHSMIKSHPCKTKIERCTKRRSFAPFSYNSRKRRISCDRKHGKEKQGRRSNSRLRHRFFRFGFSVSPAIMPSVSGGSVTSP